MDAYTHVEAHTRWLRRLLTHLSTKGDTMVLIYDTEHGWALRQTADLEDFILGEIGPHGPFPEEWFPDIESCILPLDNSDCVRWMRAVHSRYKANASPYYPNYYVPDWPAAINARQLMIARHLNTHFLNIPKFRIGLTCGYAACVNVHHLIPYNYFPRTREGTRRDAAAVPVAIKSEEELQAIRDLFDNIKSPPRPLDVQAILRRASGKVDPPAPIETTSTEDDKDNG